MIYGLDISNYQNNLTLDRLLRWKELGWEHLVIRGSLEDRGKRQIAHQQFELAAQAGLTVATYIWAYFTADGPEDTAADAVREYGQHSPLVYWVDCEETKYVGTPNQNITWLHRNLASYDALGVRAGIYTGQWWWSPYMSNSNGFASRPLWNAHYDDWQALSNPGYGGWESCQGKQFQGSGKGQVEGYAIDLNVFDDAWLYGAVPTPAPEEGMADEALISKLGYLQGDVAQALQDGLDGARKAKMPKDMQARNEALDSIQAAINTLREV